MKSQTAAINYILLAEWNVTAAQSTRTRSRVVSCRTHFSGVHSVGSGRGERRVRSRGATRVARVFCASARPESYYIHECVEIARSREQLERSRQSGRPSAATKRCTRVALRWSQVSSTCAVGLSAHNGALYGTVRVERCLNSSVAGRQQSVNERTRRETRNWINERLQPARRPALMSSLTSSGTVRATPVANGSRRERTAAHTIRNN